MKKLFTSLLSIFIVLTMVSTNVSALTNDESYQAAQNWYKTHTVLESVDDIMAAEAVGIQTESGYTIDESILHPETDDMYASELAKEIIALSLSGHNPNDIDGKNLVTLLESYVQTNGAVVKSGTDTAANFQIYCVYALYVVGSDQLSIAANYLKSLQLDDGSFAYTSGGVYPDLALTSWAVEVLTLISSTQYKEIIDKAIQYIQKNQVNHMYTTYGVGDPNTQACVITGLSIYNKTMITNEAYAYLLTYQNSDGSFWSPYDHDTNPTNILATQQGIQAIGSYYNGSVFTRAEKEYQLLIQPVKTPEPTPQQPDTTTQSQPTQQATTVQAVKSVATGDDVSMTISLSLLFVSLGLIIFLKKTNEKTLS